MNVITKLGLVFTTAVVGSTAIGAFVGYQFGKQDAPPPKYCVEEPRKQVSYPRTKAEIARFVRQFRNQDGGWIK